MPADLTGRTNLDDADRGLADLKSALARLPLQPAQTPGIAAKAGLKTEGDLLVLSALASVTGTFDPDVNVSAP